MFDVPGNAASSLRGNVELKARLHSLPSARQIAAALATSPVESQAQRDTYFHVATGRLKLREIEGQTAQLVWYSRADQAAAKRSDYRLVAVAHPDELREALVAACGVRAVVEKHREIFLYNNVRIHLDTVTGLGDFIEFEAVLGPEVNESAGRAQVEFLQSAFQLTVDDLVAVSYVELMLRRPATS